MRSVTQYRHPERSERFLHDAHCRRQQIGEWTCARAFGTSGAERFARGFFDVEA
jgi:hypothetical protein